MLTRRTVQAILTWATLLSLGHAYNVWIGALGVLVVGLLYSATKED